MAIHVCWANMESVKSFAAMLTLCVIGCAVSGVAMANPQDYCAAYAAQFANTKIGFSTDHLVDTLGGNQGADAREPGSNTEPTGDAATDEKWQGAYNTTFDACMDRYTPQPLTASADPPTSAKVNLGTKKRKVQSSSSPSKSSKRRGTKSKRNGAAIRAPKSQPQEAQPTVITPAATDESLCRRVRADKNGAYHIENCNQTRSKGAKAARP
jgi:hypothetical protein